MQAIFWTVEEVAQRAKQFYENGIEVLRVVSGYQDLDALFDKES